MSEYGKPRDPQFMQEIRLGVIDNWYPDESASDLRRRAETDKVKRDAAKAALNRQHQEILDSLQFDRAARTLRAALGTSKSTDWDEVSRTMRKAFE